MNGKNNITKSVTFLTKDVTTIPREKFLSSSQQEALKRVNIMKFLGMPDSVERNTARKHILNFIGTLSPAQVLLFFITEGLITYSIDNKCNDSNDSNEVSMEFYQFYVPSDSPVLAMISSYLHAAKTACKTLKSKFELKTRQLANGRIQVQIIDNYPVTNDYRVYGKINSTNCILINWVLTDNSNSSFDDNFYHQEFNKSIQIKDEYKHILCSEEAVMKQIQKSLKDFQHTKTEEYKTLYSKTEQLKTEEQKSEKQKSEKQKTLPNNWSSIVMKKEEQTSVETSVETSVDVVKKEEEQTSVDVVNKDEEGEVKYVKVTMETADIVFHNLTTQVNNLSTQVNHYYNNICMLQSANQEIIADNNNLIAENDKLRDNHTKYTKANEDLAKANEELVKENEELKARIRMLEEKEEKEEEIVEEEKEEEIVEEEKEE